ncbi:MAG: nitroreductase [Azoarcus sp.]|jgi:nitroreductase|nr:nitroreductase [Azoarcus sp.]
MSHPDPHIFAAVADTLRARHTTRRFLPTPVTRETVAELLKLASAAPSGTNAQPQKVYALAGEALKKFCAIVHGSFETLGGEPHEYEYYPAQWAEPWLSRRRKLGFDLYGAVGIARGDKARMQAQTGRNYLFFDAPVGLIFTQSRHLAQGMFLDQGIFIANLVVAAQAKGLATCVQTAWAELPASVHRALGIGADEIVVAGMALGHADPAAPENALRTEREPVEGFTDFRGF